jgi:hypothetical protein
MDFDEAVRSHTRRRYTVGSAVEKTPSFGYAEIAARFLGALRA